MQKVKKIIKDNYTFIKYTISAGISFVLDLALFSIFIILLKGNISNFTIIATVLARIISSLFNYLVNRNRVFKTDEDSKIDSKTLFKYYTLVIIQTFVSAFVVSYLCSIIIMPLTVLMIPKETIIKIPIEIVLFIVNFFVQKYFIFTKNPVKINIPENIRSIVFGITMSFTLLFKLNKSSIIITSGKDNNFLVISIVAIFFIYFYKKLNKKYQDKNNFNFLALLFSFFMTVGYSYDVFGSAYLLFGNFIFIIISIIKFISYYLFFRICINILYDFLCNYHIRDYIKKNKLIKMFNKHPFLFSFIVIIICYIPYIIAFYPAVLSYDPANQIKEVMGIHTRYMDSVIMIDPSVTITNFNPILHTLLLGGLFKFGNSIGYDNLGLFIYTIIQTIIMASTLAYSISYMKKQKVANKLLLIVLGIYALVPVFPFYAISTNKDTIFCCFILLYCIKLFDLIVNKQNNKKYIIIFLITLMVMLLRNNGIYAIMLSLPFTLIWLKEKRKQILTIIVGIIVCYIGYNSILLPSLKISNTSIREMLSIPFQQTARLALIHPESFSEEDKEIIDKVLTFDTLKDRYNPRLSDPVKNEFNIYTTNEELKGYFKVWFKGLTKHPDVYIDATISNTYGYFYPNTSRWYIYYKYNTKLAEAGFDYHYNGLSGMRNFLSGFGDSFPKIPILGLIVNIAFTGWIYMFLFNAVIVRKKKKFIPFLLPALSFLLVCVASPANTYFRYALPYIMPLPMTICLLYYVLNKDNYDY